MTVDIKSEELTVSNYSTPGSRLLFGHSPCGVKILHKPSGITTECEESRSPHQNKMKAMEELKQQLEEANTPVKLSRIPNGGRFTHLDDQEKVFVMIDRLTFKVVRYDSVVFHPYTSVAKTQAQFDSIKVRKVK